MLKKCCVHSDIGVHVLQIGLAVSDVKQLREQAIRETLVMQVFLDPLNLLNEGCFQMTVK